MGWGLKRQKSCSRFPVKVKAYLNDKFLIGEETGNKGSPTLVAGETRRERDDKGDRLFLGADCLSSQQVAAYFSRLAVTKRKHGSLTTTVVNWDEVEELMDEEQAEEHQHGIVFANLQLRHPVTYKTNNLCKLAADGKLAMKFSIAEMDIDTDNFRRPKAPYLEALANVLNNCTCITNGN